MGTIDETLQANRTYVEGFRLGELPTPPARKLAVLACMDARMQVEAMLGLDPGDAHIIRNAGGIATEDALRSLIVSHRKLGTREFMVINHTDCGMLTFKDHELVEELERDTGVAAVTPAHFHAFTDLEANVARQVRRIQSHPWIPDSIPVRGFVYDVHSGTLSEVAP